MWVRVSGYKDILCHTLRLGVDGVGVSSSMAHYDREGNGSMSNYDAYENDRVGQKDLNVMV